MSEPGARRYDTTGATGHDHLGTEHDLPETGVDVDRQLDDSVDEGLHHRAHDHLGEREHELTTTGVDVDEQLDESVDEGLHRDRHHHRLGEAEEHEHELTTMGVDVDAALDRAVEENL